MKNAMIKVIDDNGKEFWLTWLAFPEQHADEVAKVIASHGIKVTVYHDDIPFDELPESVKEEAKRVLKAYDEVTVEYENSKWHASAMVGISAHYPADHFVAGFYKASKVFTEEERIINYAESFHDFSPLYKGKRDYAMMRECGYDWNIKFKIEDGNLVRA